MCDLLLQPSGPILPAAHWPAPVAARADIKYVGRRLHPRSCRSDGSGHGDVRTGLGRQRPPRARLALQLQGTRR